MYTEQDYKDNQKQLKKRLIIIGIPLVLLLGFVIWSFVVRIRILTMALTILLGALCIFLYGMLLSPVICYGRHLKDVLYGRTRELTGAYKSMEEKTVWREGVEYYPFYLNIGDMNNEEDDRLFYFDANLPKPTWQTGEMLKVVSHDKSLGSWKSVS